MVLFRHDARIVPAPDESIVPAPAPAPFGILQLLRFSKEKIPQHTFHTKHGLRVDFLWFLCQKGCEVVAVGVRGLRSYDLKWL